MLYLLNKFNFFSFLVNRIKNKFGVIINTQESENNFVLIKIYGQKDSVNLAVMVR